MISIHLVDIICFEIPNKAMKLHQLNDSLFRCDLLGLLLNDMAGGDGCGLFGWVRATDHPSIFN